ncbi:hypothetical protein FQR65_LT04644 [Abscondita terminalis]|nr:hypothetical protein FQR65_LT04644 [Abscondita terminalis]
MLPKYSVWVLSVVVAITQGASEQPRSNNSKDELPNKYSLPLGPPVQYNPSPYPVGGVDPQFQFNYIPNKQYYPSAQPPFIIYGGAGLPGQQFLYRPGSPPPGNFLIPQPDFGFGNPQTPVFSAGYPKPAHIPPIEKDAEEVPNLAGNHHPTRTGRPNFQVQYPVRPQKIETFDEVESGEEVDDLEQAEKIPNNFYPKKAFPNRPVLKPGQQFFILNGNTLFSNVPLEQGPISQQSLYRSAPRIVAKQHKLKEEQPQQPSQKESENYVSLNNLADFRQDFFLKEPAGSVEHIPLILQDNQHGHLPYLVPNPVEDEFRLGRNFHFNPPVSPYGQVTYPYVLAFDYDQKQDDDTVTIEANSEEEKKAEEVPPSSTTEEPSISQAKPSALAISGVGGVASAGPRGTSLVGKNGIAVASPQATAVAGPAKDEPEKKPKPTKQKQ